jgi:hypothetical protein
MRCPPITVSSARRIRLPTYKPGQARNTKVGIQGSLGLGSSYPFAL